MEPNLRDCVLRDSFKQNFSILVAAKPYHSSNTPPTIILLLTAERRWITENKQLSHADALTVIGVNTE